MVSLKVRTPRQGLDLAIGFLGMNFLVEHSVEIGKAPSPPRTLTSGSAEHCHTSICSQRAVTSLAVEAVTQP